MSQKMLKQTDSDIEDIITSQSLNNSSSSHKRKKVHMTEVEPSHRWTFEPSVKIVTNKLQGITFGVPTWTTFLQQINIIDDYFEKEKQPSSDYTEPLEINDCKVIFTTSFGEKSVIFDSIPVPVPVAECENSENAYEKVCPDNHLCYITPVGNPRYNKKVAYTFYDFETQQSESVVGQESTKIHVPNLCVAQQVCDECMDDPDPNVRCKWCDIRQYIFSEDPVSEFTKFATRKMSHFTETFLIAHNAKGFDAQFILSHLIKEKGLRNPPEIILNGTSILLVKMPLRQLPEAFGLEEAKKGTFPHLFNTPKNQEYIGKIPDAKYFSPDTVSREARDSFYKACLAFRALFLKVANIDPFIESITIASACSKVFRKNDLKADQIGVLPNGGYRRANRQSKKAIEWLLALERDLDIEITRSGRAREFRLPDGCLVDGYFENKETTHLNPRDAFYGGRTGNTFSYYEAKGKVNISYLDVCSLYPFVSKYGKFPIGHPKVYIGDDCKSLTGVNFDLSNVEGLVKCRVLPPTNKYLPVLPVRMHGKLMFPLCNTCCKEQIQSDCPHVNNTNAREIEGTWVSDEIKAAIQEGYQITAIFEIW
ncbi:uncharacterized protein LOC117170699 [Belonocnema kinseyi]|uniref:uncharacterized protein LOC117170699 n=1 Tax=Belonocnema kinseyi TaxID=2817044 RepID=UPI00143CF0BF|nr:uncharacterized protein LOC117170699 [Belonocnema kinseyi]